MNQRMLGGVYEEQAAAFLEQQGYGVLEKNYRCRMGEIDLIAMDSEYLVFVEVKYRRDGQKGNPVEAVGYRKQRTISKVAAYYLMSHGMSMEKPCRFDVVGILGEEITLIKDAFPYRER